MIVPRIYDIIKHERFMDICFEVHSFKQYSTNYYTVKGVWINMLFEKSQYISSQSVKIKIRNEDIKYWSLATETHLPCLRKSNWRKLA